MSDRYRADQHVSPRAGRVGDPRWRRFAVLLLLLASLTEPVVETLTTDRAHYVEGATVAPRPLVEAATALSNAVIPLVALGVLLLALLWAKVDGRALVLVSLPSLTMTVNEFVHGRALGPSLLLPAVAGILLVTLRVNFADLALLGYAGGIVAAISLLGMVFAPAFVLMSAGLAFAEKSITGAPLLAGIFSHSNILGLYLAASLPFAFLARRFIVRWTIVLILVLALVMTSSRTALFGAAVVLIVILVGWILPRAAFRPVLVVTLIVLCIALVQVPFSETDPSAYTYRGEIWMYNIGLLAGNWLFGLGAWFYTDDYARLSQVLSAAASHAHNDLLTNLVMGGLLLVSVIGLVLISAWRGADGYLDRRQGFVGGAFLAGVVALSITETTMRFASWGPLSASLLVPLFVMVADASARRGAPTTVGLVPAPLVPPSSGPVPSTRRQARAALGGSARDHS
ncbi:O-antigen ligase family protein [Microbacterium sp. BWR-S6Y]|uniref:O-antigen ligase family protein n=1 Tax=Microbacterium sp. BWR-S6Y TaxID=3232073 RepID=UPI0035278AAA